MKVRIISGKGSIEQVYLNDEKLEKYVGDNSRMVFIGKNYVVKLNECKTRFMGDRQCLSEYLKYTDMKECDKHLFVPVLEYGIIETWEYIISPKYEFKILDSPIIKSHRDWDYLIDALIRNGISDVWNGFNCGISETENLYCYDYGL